LTLDKGLVEGTKPVRTRGGRTKKKTITMGSAKAKRMKGRLGKENTGDGMVDPLGVQVEGERERTKYRIRYSKELEEKQHHPGSSASGRNREGSGKRKSQGGKEIAGRKRNRKGELPYFGWNAVLPITGSRKN